MKFNKNIQDLIPTMKKWRQTIHSFPEIAYEEYKTAEFIEKKLKEFGIKVIKNIGKTGLVGILEGKKKSSKSIGLRADMDALPMDEKTNLSYSSKNLGKMHACGHDGHVTMLLGAAKILSEDKNFSGKVYFIFQPAEEGGRAGAKSMINDGLFKKFKIDNVWGIHNWPGVELGKAVIHKQFAMAGGDIFEINILGKGGHAAQPNVSNDPIIALGFIIVSLQTIVSRQLDPFSNAVLSITKINSGSAFNVIPESAYLGGTLRSTNEHDRDNLLNKIKILVEQTAISHNCKVDFRIIPGYPPTVNDEKSASFAHKIYEKYFGKDMINENCTPTMGSEDFSYFLKKVPGCFAWIGNGASASLHNPKYDFNDSILTIGSSFLASIAEERLS